MRMPLLQFFVPGTPQPQGSKTAYRSGGKIVLVEGRRKKSQEAFKAWRSAVAQAATMVANESSQPWPFKHTALFVATTFVFVRPVVHISAAGDIKQSYRDKPKLTRPDRDKLDRALMDACTGILWADDALVVGAYVRKRYITDLEFPGVHVSVYEACWCGAPAPCVDCTADLVLP